MKNKELGIYVHMPFCKSKCYYCDFVSYANSCYKIDDYIEQVIKEIDEYDLKSYNITTIYIGGRNSFIYRRKIYSKIAK